jgi:hypothetical protein
MIHLPIQSSHDTRAALLSRWFHAPVDHSVRRSRSVKLGLIGVVALLVANAFAVPSLELLVGFDLVFVAVALLWAKPADDIALVLVLLLAYYSLPLPVALVSGLAEWREVAIPALEDIGLRPSFDLPKYALCLLLFKCGLLAAQSAASAGTSRILWGAASDGRPQSELVSLLLLFAVGFVLREATGNTLFVQIVLFSGAHLAYVVVVAGRTGASRLLRFCVLTAVAFLITRSRETMAVAALGLLSLEWQKTRRYSVRLALVIGASFLLASAYGAYRDEGSPDSLFAAFAERSRFEVSGESGIMFQTAAHVIGLRDAAVMPPEFDDSIPDKLIRVVPLFPGKLPMLADRYMRYFFPAIAADSRSRAWPRLICLGQCRLLPCTDSYWGSCVLSVSVWPRARPGGPF